MVARERFGRISDVIHAAAIGLVLPRVMEPEETLHRPSLAAGNDPSRPFDVASDLRIAEFKLARWDGHDSGRQRAMFKDAVMLLDDQSGRRAELYVLGERPVRWLTSTNATVAWALARFPPVAKRFAKRFGSADVAISTFMREYGSELVIVDLEREMPDLFAPVPGITSLRGARDHALRAPAAYGAAMDFDRAAQFIAAIPRGRWTAYKDVAIVAGNALGAQAVGDWLRRRGDEVPHVYRVLTVEGRVPEGFIAAGSSVPADAVSVREMLVSEGIRLDAMSCAAADQRFTHHEWDHLD